jgi:hypothetical protein
MEVVVDKRQQLETFVYVDKRLVLPLPLQSWTNSRELVLFND